MFMSNNRASFNLWSKENLVKHQRVAKYYENNCNSEKDIEGLKRRGKFEVENF